MILQGEYEKQNHIYYELDRTRPPLGRGGTGVVYKGEQIDEITGATRPVAIKEIYQNSQTQEIVRRARWEASIQVRNENLIEMLGFIETTESKMNIVTTRYYVISEYLAGITLDKVLEGVTVDQQGEKMPAAEQLYIAYQQDKNQTACNMVKQILNGLTILHDRGIIHRDIDPSNIMVTQDGHLKLIDFGISKKLQQASESVTGTFVAKPYYAAPEQIRGESSKQSPATDIYQMGVLFYQLLTGELPFTGSDHEILDGHLKRKPNLQAINNPTYREVIRKAMEKNSQKRYLSTSAMRVALDTPHSSHTTAVLASLAAVLVMVVAVVTLNSRKPEEPVNPINIEEQGTSKKVAKNDPKEKETLKELEETDTLDVPIEPDTIITAPVKTLSRDEEDIWEFLRKYDGDEKLEEWKYKQKALDILKSNIDNPYALLYFAAWVIKTNPQNSEEEKSREEIYGKLKDNMDEENYVKKEDGKAKITNWDYSRLKCGVLAIIRANEKATDKEVKDCANDFFKLDPKAPSYFILNLDKAIPTTAPKKKTVPPPQTVTQAEVRNAPAIAEDKTVPQPPRTVTQAEVRNVPKNVEDDAGNEETAIVSAEDQTEFVETTDDVPIVVEEPEEEQQIFQVVENMPEFPGGTAALMQYLKKNIKYPTTCQEQGIQGRVIVQFVVNKDGSIGNPEVIKAVNPYLDKEALRLISTMPKWKPGEQGGKPVRVKYIVPVPFHLSN